MSTFVSWLVVLALAAGMGVQAQTQPPIDLTQANLEDLMNLTVTSVSKREQKLSRTAAAAFVIRAEDIRRSGALNLPDLLRMVPGVDVSQIDANTWAISIRGFNARYSNKVLVLIDGRTVYTPSFSGVYWEHLDMPLENIDRIEVIRGPGATVWGANAVNGVISIFTKYSKNTRGGHMTDGGGSATNGLGLLQYGDTVGQTGSYRAFVKEFYVGNSELDNGSHADDHFQRLHGGFRSDWDLTDRDSLMVQGDLFSNESSERRWGGIVSTPYDVFFNQHVDATGGDVLARWDHRLQGGGETSLQSYYDTYRRDDMGVPEVLRMFDLDFQDHLSAGDRHDIVWGGGYRTSTSYIGPGYWIGLNPPSRNDQLFSVFLQDEIRISDSLWFTPGCKLEHNAYTGFGLEPSLRLAWAPLGSRHTFWASASRAMRQPSRVDASVRADLLTIPAGPGVVFSEEVLGNPHVKAEELRDYETGYRAELAKTLSLDVDAFLSFYHHLETIEPQPQVIVPGSPLEMLTPYLYDNQGHAVDYGGEVSVKWNVTRRWRVSPGYSYLHANLRQDPSSQGLLIAKMATDFPRNMLQFRSAVNLSPKVEFDQSLYYTARLPGAAIPGHTRLDLRLSRKLGESAEISLIGQNLLRPLTWEYGNSFGLVGTEVQRSVYGQIAWRF